MSAKLVTKITTDSQGRIVQTFLGEHPSDKAFAVAKRAAGKGAKFASKGLDRGYIGPECSVWVST